MNDLVSPSSQIIFENRYELVEYISKLINSATAWEETSTRLSDAHLYVKDYCMPEGWGKNVWHTILDDAIRMRQEQEDMRYENRTK